jgi:ATP-dependent helicase/nuclease subunit B
MPSFDAAARQLLAEQGHRLPDLSGITLLVPHRHLVAPFLAALRRQIAETVFMPPRAATLPALALPTPCESDSRRLSALHGFLAGVDWLDQASLWTLAQTLLDLLNELDDEKLRPPGDFGGFARQIELAAKRSLNSQMEREARLIFELWRAFHEAGPGVRAGYAQGLAWWLKQASGPIYSLGLSRLSGMERRFIEACQSSPGLTELPLSEPWPERRALLDAALRTGPEPLLERARKWAERMPASPLDLAWFAAPDMESEALYAADRIRRWLAEGRRDIAVIALDRLAARRLRAVLERDRILMQDETGWTFATATVSHVLDRWFALIQDGFYHRDLFDLAKSPFAFADAPAAERLEAVAALEHLAGKHNVISGLDRFISFAVGPAANARPLLLRLSRAAETFRQRRRQTLAGWLGVLFKVLDEIGSTAAFAADQAGRQLLDLLRRLSLELAGDTTLYSLAQWRGWLNLQLDRTTFVADDIESPIRLTHLAAARLRDFDAVVVLGVDAAHLPPVSNDPLFGDAVRVQLGLPGLQKRRDDTLADFIDVLSRSGRALITWQARHGVEPNPASPWLERLEAFHVLAYASTLAAPPLPRPQTPPETLADAVAPSLTALPAKLSASGWQTLVDCPYRFFARHGLGLGEEEEVAETMEKADYGELVHDILKRFHGLHPRLNDWPREQLTADLHEIGRTVFEQREQDHYLARAWRLRWEKHVPAYLDWALAHEAAGWRWREAEATFERELALADGRTITLHGRLDRLDEGPEGLAVLDYKTQSLAVLRNKLRMRGEHVQLPFYGLLADAARAGLIALDDDKKVDAVEMPQPLADAATDEEARLRSVLEAVAEGAPMPAHGAPETCQWCEMRGLCRRA